MLNDFDEKRVAEVDAQFPHCIHLLDVTSCYHKHHI